MDLGQLNRGIELLDRCLQLAPRPLARLRSPGAWLPEGRRLLAGQGVRHCLALAADPRNPMALKNLGAIFGKEGDRGWI